MKKTLSLVLALAMAFSCASAAFAVATDFATNTGASELIDPTTFNKPYEVNEVIVEADEATGQVRLEARTKEIIEVDGLKFKDLNANGTLDVYEDWRQDIDARVDDLLSQMTLDEEIGLLWHASTGGTFTSMYPYTEEWLYSNEPTYISEGDVCYVPMYHSIISDNITTYLHNVNGTPDTLIYENNAFQEIAESARLGVPVVLSCDRSYNTWAGMVNLANYALGISHDEELVYDLVAQYAAEERAIGFHVPFHSYGVEIGSWYGDDPNYIATMVGVETRAYEENGVNACTKHFVARGGRSGYSSAKSPANLIDSWLVGWNSAVIENGSGWIMLNNGSFLNNCNVCYDSESMAVLREQLGYDGCVVTDWPMWTKVPDGFVSGVTPQGVDLTTCTVGELYTIIFNADVDQVGCFFMVEPDVACTAEAVDAAYPGMQQPQWPHTVKEQIEQGNLSKETIDVHAKRVLRNKFELGLFEDPYSSLDDALALAASDAYIAEAFELTTIEDVYAARNDRTNELEIRLQTEATVLMKNENNVLPLSAGAKVYIDGTTKDTVEMDKEALAAYATVVDTMEEADVVIAHVTAMNDSTELIIEDAADCGKPVVLCYEGTVSSEPDAYAFENCDAILFLTFNCTPDHGSSMGNFYHYTLPSVLADMIFGTKEPTGKTVYEIGWTAEDAASDWGELQYDTGVDTRTRLYMAAMARNNPTVEMPTNLGDVIIPAHYGMNYGQAADIRCDTLVVPQSVVIEETETSSGIQTSSVLKNMAVAGEPFEINFIAQNFGADGHITAEVYVDGQLAATKLVSLTADQFRVVTIELTLESGAHEISVLGMTASITVE